MESCTSAPMVSERTSPSRETFDAGTQTGYIEVLDEKDHYRHQLTKRQYQYIQQRPLHSHGYLELMIVLSGSVYNHVEGEGFTYRAGQGCLMNTNIRHREEPIETAEVMFLEMRQEFLDELRSTMEEEGSSFKGSILTGFLKEACEASSGEHFGKHYLEFSPLGDDVGVLPAQNRLCCDSVDALREHRPGSSFLIREATLGFFDSLGNPSLYTLQSVSSEADHNEFLVSKIDLMLHTSHGKLKKRELEEQMAYNGDYLNRVYKKQKGISISEAGREIMIKDAKQLLMKSNMSIDEIMQELGASSRGYFFSLFHEKTGLTPKEYRSKYKYLL